jgi:hypothetical protein
VENVWIREPPGSKKDLEGGKWKTLGSGQSRDRDCRLQLLRGAAEVSGAEW